jgi:hypothetical protein
MSDDRPKGKGTVDIEKKKIDAELERERIAADLEAKRIEAELETRRIEAENKRLTERNKDKDGARNDRITLVRNVFVGLVGLIFASAVIVALVYNRTLIVNAFTGEATVGHPDTPKTVDPAP